VKKLLVLCVFLALGVACAGRTITVDANSPADFNNIQAAIDDSNDGDTVVVLPGTYTGPGSYDIDFGERAITVRSTDPNDANVVAATVIEEGNFYLHSGEGPNSVIDGLTVARASGDGIYCDGSSPTIRNCVIVDCTVSGIYVWEGGATVSDCTIMGCEKRGGIECAGGNVNVTIRDCIISNNMGRGGIYCAFDYPGGANSVVNVSGCTITGNSTSYFGGGISYCPGEITGCNISGNSAGYGGGISGCWGEIRDCNISGNSAEYGGGVYYCYGEITGCNIIDNHAGGNGGGLYDCNELTDCTISNNAGLNGGGIYWSTWNEASPALTRCRISGNTAEGSGGGIYFDNSVNDLSATITDCRVTGNRAEAAGGGIYGPSSDVVTSNCIISGNTASEGAGIEQGDGSVTNCTFVGNYNSGSRGGTALNRCRGPLSNCIIWCNGSPALVRMRGEYSCVQDDLSGLGNIYADPCFVDAGRWVDANDPDIIVEGNEPNAVWVDGDYHLKSEGWRWDVGRRMWKWDDVTSQCIDAGNPGSLLSNEPLAVPPDPTNQWGQNLRINMGAYGGTAEASMPPYDWALLTDITNDGTTDSVDLSYFTDYWLTSEADLPGDFDRNSVVDFGDFARLGGEWLAKTSWRQ